MTESDTPKQKTPNAETLAAMKECETIECRFKTGEELIASIEAEVAANQAKAE